MRSSKHQARDCPQHKKSAFVKALFDATGDVLIVTGGARGIGSALIHRL
ncbi:hypothetical protein GCM10027062_44040 [Nocardioides hungaricus]